jgi:O-antigen/teichoic acid export membrane protein
MLISLWRGDHEVGIYQSVFRIIALCLILPDITIAATLPSLARLYDNDRMQWIKLGSVLNRMLIHIGLFLGLFLIVGAESIINVLYGLKSYNAAVSLMKIFGIVVIIRYSVEIPALMLTTSRQQYKRMFLVVVATVVNVLLNMIAIPKYGIYGAAIVSLIVNALVGIGYIVTVKKSYYYQLFSLNNILPLCLTIMMFIVTILFPHYSFWYVSVVAFIIYASIVFNFGYKKEEKKILIQNSILAFKR